MALGLTHFERALLGTHEPGIGLGTHGFGELNIGAPVRNWGSREPAGSTPEVLAPLLSVSTGVVVHPTKQARNEMSSMAKLLPSNEVEAVRNSRRYGLLTTAGADQDALSWTQTSGVSGSGPEEVSKTAGPLAGTSQT